MEVSDIAQEIVVLPPQAQNEVMDFVAFLKTRHRKKKASKKTKAVRLSDEPFIGMWRDREDMKDSTEWVRSLRRRERKHSA